MRKSLATLLVTVITATLTVLPTGTAAAAGSFTFFGSGWGHGLGLSQWGAYGLALDGWAASRILTHFYSHARVATADGAPDRLRVGLVQGRQRVRLTAEVGDVDLHLGDPQGDAVASIPSGETWSVSIQGGAYRVEDASGHAVGDAGGMATNLYATYEPSGARVRIPEAGHAYNRGWIEFNIAECSDRCTMRLVLSIPPQEYLYGLAEIPSSWPRPALQAQAIAARTYAFHRLRTSGQHREGCNCALYASPLDQVYAGWDKEGGADGNRWVAAVDATDGKTLVYQGDLIQAFYSSSSGGHTENNENVWGGSAIPYLRGVCDPGDYTAANPNAVWQVSLSSRQVTSKLDLRIGAVQRFTDVVRGVSGRIVSALVVGANGGATISGDDLRSGLGLKDDRVWINANRQVTGEIRQKYDAIGCRPGLPTSRRSAVAGGLRQRFERATIFYRSGVGAHSLGGAVLAEYLDRGGPGGRLGFPITDVRTLSNGSRRARFERGVITCRASGCRVSFG
jgi:SpoIID/LytB domain protein